MGVSHGLSVLGSVGDMNGHGGVPYVFFGMASSSAWEYRGRVGQVVISCGCLGQYKVRTW